MRTLILVAASCALLACTPSMQVTNVDTRTGTSTTTNYAPYFGTRTMLVENKVGLDLVVDFEKKVIPGVYQLQQSLGALGPGDLDASGLFTAYVHNLTAEPQILHITAMTAEGQSIPGIPLSVTLKPHSYETLVLGRIGIPTYATQLRVNISYTIGAEVLARELTAIRLTQAQIDASVAKWKGKDKSVPAFFPD